MQQHVPGFITALAPIVSQYGYLGVGGLITLEDFGVPAPGETVLIAGAFYAGLGHLNIVLVALVGFAGAVIGDNIGFAIGNYGGQPLVRRFGRYIFLTPERIGRATAYFDRRGGQIVIVARFIEGLRQANGIIAGLSAMRWPMFTAYNAIGAALWVGLWSGVGYFGGSHIETFLRYQLYFTIGILAAAAMFITYKIVVRSRVHRV